MSRRVVINECFGGFTLSSEAEARLRELGWTGDYSSDIARDDPLLLQVIDELGPDQASGSVAALAVAEIPDDVKWYIHDYDGYERVYEQHRSWTSNGEAQASA